MKKTLAVLLSIIMLFGVPMTSFASDDASAYDRAAIAANDEEYIETLSAEQIASVVLDWADREIAKYTEEIEADIVAGVIANGGFEEFEAILGEDAMGNIIADQIPAIDSLDAVVGYKDYLAELGGDFATLDATNLVTREAAGSALGFIDGVLQFMADNSETFGKVFRWDDEVFDYGKVGEYILTLDTTDPENKKIVDFYNDYLIGNDIQAKFTKWVADQMGYTIPEGETFDDTLNNGILGWFVGLCETNGILSADAIAELETYDLRTTDIYTLIKNFVVLAQEDNQVKLDTYYNFLMDTVVRTLLKTTLGQVATVGAAAEVPAGFTATYTDLALLEEISGGTAYYKDGDAYYQVTIADGVATANVITWADALDINFEPPVATIYTGKDGATKVAEYKPSSTKYLSVDEMPVYMYATAKNQTLVNNTITGGDETKTGITFAGTEIPADYADLMIDANKKVLDSRFLFKVEGKDLEGNDLAIPAIDIDFTAIEEFAEAEALKAAQSAVASFASFGISIDSVDVVLSYTGWATEDEFIAQVAVDDIIAYMNGSAVTKDTPMIGETMMNMMASMIDNPLMTIVADELSGNLNIDDAKALLDFIDTDFAIDADLLDFAGNYDEYDGVVGQVNHVLYGLVDMLVSDSGMQKLNLVDGDNTNLNANLEKICATANDMMAAAEEVINNEEYKELAGQIGIDIDAILADFDTELLYKIDFSSVEALWVSVITLGLDLIDDGTDELIAEIHALIGDLKNLDAMAVAVADYVLGKCIPDLNKTLADAGVDFALTVPAETDASAVADGAGKDIIMTKLVDLVYEAAVKGVALANTYANELIGHVEGETNVDLPTVAFELGVAKGATWMETLTGLTNRVYELADGIIIACAEKPADTIDAISKVANDILPLGSLASNCAANGYAFDGNTVMGYLFDDGLEGDIDGFLCLFETKVKTEDVAADVSVTEALIEASEHIVDAIFPDTVKSELYVDNYGTGKFTEITVQEYFTGAENDAVIASNNMDSINARKADLVPAALNLVREAGVLPFFAKCDKDHTEANLTLVAAKVEPKCGKAGSEAKYACDECGYSIGGEEIPALSHDWSAWNVTKEATCTDEGEKTATCGNCGETKKEVIAKKSHSYGAWKTTKEATCTAKGEKVATCGTCGGTKTEAIPVKAHSYGDWKVTKAATCAENGVETRTCSCGKEETRSIATTAHTDADKDNACDECGKTIDNSFGAKIKAFFQKIINWFKNLFKKK